MASNSDADYVGKVLNEVRDQIAVDDDVLSETKARRNSGPDGDDEPPNDIV